MSQRIVGYSGHERGIHIPIAAAAIGAKIIEKHLTLDKDQEGTDHKVSLLPSEMRTMVSMLTDLHLALGVEDEIRQLSQGEMINRETLAKSIYLKAKVKKGDVFSRDSIVIRAPGIGLQPDRIDDFLGKKFQVDKLPHSAVYESDFFGTVIPKKYDFGMPVGIPVRYHDFQQLSMIANIDFVEFHMSYNDLFLDSSQFLTINETLDFAVHAPELFEGDHILDLASFDSDYRSKSIKNLQAVIETTCELKKFFPKTLKPLIVVNAGGWNKAGFLSKAEKDDKYGLVSEALSELELDEITLAIQTMPPFPWHFGGQSFHNLFVSSSDIVSFCSQHEKIKICLDTSHSMMACRYYGWDFYEFVTRTLPFNAYMHVADSLGVDGEGIAFGRGDINFKKLFEILAKNKSKIPFIPEIWQGHKNSGEGFWSALNDLDEMIANDPNPKIS